MNWRVIWHIFTILFVAELGDKTQIVTLAEAAEHKTYLSVFLGAMGAFACLTLMGMVLGGVIGRYVPERYMHVGAGLFFLVLGGLMIAGKV